MEMNVCQIPNGAKTLCEDCPITQIEVSAQCINCSTGEIPKSDRISCEACLSNQFVVDGITCQDCPTGMYC